MGDLATTKFAFDLDTAPAEVANIYSLGVAHAVRKGMSGADADQFACKQLNVAHWFRKRDGTWTHLAKDTRDKVNFRDGEQQPDGTFMVRDVDVFYPNSVHAVMRNGKPTPLTFSAADIREQISHTNAAIASGGQRPSLTIGHPTKEHPQKPAVGSCINWRTSPKVKDGARVDLIGVDPTVFAAWKKGEWNGLSAGIADQADGVNRFSHVALLGSSPQALSHLPQTIVYESENMVCYSIEPITEQAAPLEQGKAMAIDFSAALSALDTIKNTFVALSKADFTADQGPKKELELPEKPKLEDPTSQITNKVELGEPGKGKEPAMDYAAEFTAMKADNQRLRSVVNGLVGEKLTTDFAAFQKDLLDKGHQFDAESTMGLFKTLAGSNNRDGVEMLKASLTKSPKDARVGVGSVFNASGAGPLNAKSVDFSDDSTLQHLGISFSAEETKMGNAIADAMGV